MWGVGDVFFWCMEGCIGFVVCDVKAVDARGARVVVIARDVCVCVLGDLPESVFAHQFAPGLGGSLLQAVVGRVVRGVFGVFDEVEVPPHDEVHVVWKAKQPFELLSAAGVVVLPGGEVDIKQSAGKGSESVPGPARECDTLGLST